LVLGATALAWGLLVGLLVLFQQRGAFAYDTATYLAAGERLNAGHPLYALSPGDRPVYILPPYWTVPLVSPPLIAVLWRPLAALPAAGGLWIWWAANVAAFAATMLMLGRRRPLLVAAAMVVLVIPTGYELAYGNMNAMILLATVLTWRFSMDGRERTAGVLAAVAAAVKVVPATLLWWLLVSGRIRAVWAAGVTLVVLAALSLLGAGLDEHRAYLGVLTDGRSVGIYELSLAGLGVSAGLPPSFARLLPGFAAAAALGLIFALRHREALAFAVAVGAMVVASPTVNLNWLVMLYALLAPVVWPARAPRRDDAAERAYTEPSPVPGL